MSRRIAPMHKAPMLAQHLIHKHNVIIIPQEGDTPGPGKKSAVLSLEFEEPELVITEHVTISEHVVEQPLGIIAKVKAFVSKIGKAIEDYFDYHEEE